MTGTRVCRNLRVTNLEDLEKAILDNNLTEKQLIKVVEKSCRVFCMEIQDRKSFAKEIKEFLLKYPKLESRPFFMKDLIMMPEE